MRKVLTHQEAYGELLPLADEWRSIGILLDVPLDVINSISAEQLLDGMCLAAVLKWLEDKRREPRRKEINDVMEKIKAAQTEKKR